MNCFLIVWSSAVGAKNVNMAFRKYMERGSAILDVASCAAYDLPDIAMHHGVFELAEYHEDEFVQKTLSEVGYARKNQPGLATGSPKPSWCGMRKSARSHTERRSSESCPSVPV